MSLKSRGINAERELVHKFWAVGWACIRVAGSGSSKYPSPDLLAGNARRKLAIECKLTTDTAKYFDKQEIEDLRSFSRRFGAEAWVAVKMERRWHFLTLEDLKETPAGYAVNKDIIVLKGLSFEELLQ
jgi:Holliday junction resolvase